jgi:hypothetical protein
VSELGVQLVARSPTNCERGLEASPLAAVQPVRRRDPREPDVVIDEDEEVGHD